MNTMTQHQATRVTIGRGHPPGRARGRGPRPARAALGHPHRADHPRRYDRPAGLGGRVRARGAGGHRGTNSYGAGLSRWLRARGVAVVEVERPRRPRHDRRGKSDPVDAEAAARAVLAGEAAGLPKAGDGRVEMLRTLRLARLSAVKARTQAANQLHALVVTAPDALRARLRAAAGAGAGRRGRAGCAARRSRGRRRPRPSWR